MTEMPTNDVEHLTDEDMVTALLRASGALPDEEHATLPPPSPDLPSAAPRHLRNLRAYRGLARSRGVDLRVVLRAAVDGRLAEVVDLPAVERRDRAT